MRGACVLAVLAAAKLAMLPGHTGPVTVWWMAAYGWQDAAVAMVFAACEFGLRKAGATPRLALAGYWAVAVYAAINIPVGRAMGTPLTWPMLRAARGPLADSILVYATPTNALLILLVLALAATLPFLFERAPRPALKAAAMCGVAVVLLGPIARHRVDTRGMDRNAVTALIDTGLPRLSRRAGAGEWRESRFEGRGAEDLSRFSGAARGLNVVMVSLESTSAQYLALYGGEYDVMPNLGALSRRALVFENAYAVYPESIKGLFSVLCSRFPAFDSVPEAYENSPCRSLAAVLADAGYRTAMYHSGRFGYLGMESIIRHRGYGTLEDAGDIGGNHQSSFGVDEPATVARMLAWIDALPHGQRFFLTYLPIAGHHPYATPEHGPFAGTGEIDQYRNALRYGDVSLGALMEGLRVRDLEENTVWVIYGDHGEAFGQHEGNYGHTFFVYEENVHVPFVIVAPGLMRGQERVRKVVSLVDTAPTILDLVGIARPAEYQGRSVLDGAPRMALFFADYSLGLLGLRDREWKFVYEIEGGRMRLFDLERDAGERRDVAAEDGARVRWYQRVVRDWSGAQRAGVSAGAAGRSARATKAPM